jgi:hypothetical protein
LVGSLLFSALNAFSHALTAALTVGKSMSDYRRCIYCLVCVYTRLALSDRGIKKSIRSMNNSNL